MRTTTLPGFTAAMTLAGAGQYGGRRTDAAQDATVEAAFRVTCPSGPALGATCTILGGFSMFFPCFGNSGCMWFHAGLVNPACFTCSFS